MELLMFKLRPVVVFLLMFSLAYTAKPKRFHLITIPKSGTHLLWRYFRVLKEEIDPQINCGIPFHPAKEQGQKNPRFRSIKNQNLVLMIRDPRDIMISNVFWRDVDKIPAGCEELYEKWMELTFDEKLTLLIDPYPPFKDSKFLWVSNPKHMEYIMEYMELPSVYICRFEHLIGPKGNGSKKLQDKEIKNLATFIGIEISDGDIPNISKKLFGQRAAKRFTSFRKGQIGEWKSHFKKEHIDAFKTHLNQYLIAFGYEKDDSW